MSANTFWNISFSIGYQQKRRIYECVFSDLQDSFISLPTNFRLSFWENSKTQLKCYISSKQTTFISHPGEFVGRVSLFGFIFSDAVDLCYRWDRFFFNLRNGLVNLRERWKLNHQKIKIHKLADGAYFRFPDISLTRNLSNFY